MAILHTLLAIILFSHWQLVLGDIKGSCNLNLQITSGNKSYDLTSAAYGPVTVAGRRGGRPAVAAVQLCSSTGPCAAPAAACIVPPAEGGGGSPPLVADAGHIANDTALLVKDGSQLQLDLAPGQPCISQGRNTTFNTSILFICESSTTSADNAEGPPERLSAVMGDCSLLVIWHTPEACPRPASGPPGCPLLSYRPYRSRPGLAGLTTSQWHAEFNGTVVDARLCGGGGSKEGLCHGAPLCVTKPGGAGGKPFGSSDQPARLSAVNGSVTLTYGQPGQDQAEVLLQCREEAGAGLLVIRARHEHLLQLTLETAVICPVRQVDCRVTAKDGTLRDLSQLSRKSGAWEATDRTDGRSGEHFYINMCRALNHNQIPKLCGGVAGTAVCMRPDGGEPVSLGAVAGPPALMADGSISIVYTNGSRCGDSQYSSELQLVCAYEQREAQSLLLTGQDGCRYTFLWETAAACGQQESSGRQCAVSEPLYGHRLDVSSLRRADSDYSLRLDDGRTLYLNLCGPLVRSCAGATDQGACLVDGAGTETSYGGASSRLWHTNGVLSLRLTGGARCGDAAANHSTQVVLTCDQAAPAAVQPGLVRLGCLTYVVVPSRQACPSRRTADCRTTDGRYDLSSLTALTGNHLYREPNATYVLNVCHSVNPDEGVNCPAEAGACLVRSDGGGHHHNYTSLGAVSGGPVVRDGRLVLKYTTDQPCDGGPPRRYRATEIRFSCDSSAVGTQPQLVSTDGCLYQFAWTTASACPLREARGTANCTVQNPQTGYRFDLSPLARKDGYTTSLGGSRYQLNVCAALSQPGNCTAGTGICKTDAANASIKLNVGTANDNLIYNNGFLLLNYSDGAPCAAGRRYRTVVSFFCGAEGGQPAPRVVEDDLCTVTVHWPTELACETRVECSVDTPDGLVDLTPLVRPGGTAAAPGSGGSGGSSGSERFAVNVCRPLAPAAGLPCPAGSAVCHSNGTKHQGLGHVISAPRLQSDHVSVTYEHGSPCPGQPGRRLTSELQLFCNSSRPASESRPDWPQYVDCRFTFQWQTAAACPLSPADDQARRRCRVRRPDDTVTDLNTLTAAHSQQVQFADQTVRLRPCQTDQQCGGAVCVGALSYGEPASFSVSQPGGDHTVTVLQYTTEATCTRTGGGQTTRGSTLRLICDPALGRGTPIITQLTACHVTAAWRSSAVCGAARSGGPAASTEPPPPPPGSRGTGHAVAWLLVAVIAAALLVFLVCRGRWRGGAGCCACCQMWGALRRQLLSPGTRATAHYRPVRVEDSDEAETALLLEAPLEEQQSPRPAARRRPPGHSPPPPGDMTDVCLDPSCDSDDELLLV